VVSWHRKFINDVDDVLYLGRYRLLIFLAIVIAVASALLLLERPLARPLEPRREGWLLRVSAPLT
jgi:hypothetical protein